MSEFVTQKQFNLGIQEILEALNAFSTRIDQRFEAIDKHFSVSEYRMKSYVDDKFWDLQGELTGVVDRRVRKHEVQMH